VLLWKKKGQFLERGGISFSNTEKGGDRDFSRSSRLSPIKRGGRYSCLGGEGKKFLDRSSRGGVGQGPKKEEC